MKVGLIGCGRVANLHMIVYKNIQNVKVVAVSDINTERAKSFANKYGINKFFANYLDLLEIKDLDLVDVCTPVSTHAQIARDIARFGYNILLEKPMALTTDECEEMIFEARKHGVSLCICHNRIFDPLVKRAKHIVDSGHYELTSFRASIKQSPELVGAPSWVLTPEEKGILWETGCHAAYLQLHFLPNVKEVYAMGSKVKYSVYDEFTALSRTSDQAHGIIEISWLAKESEVLYEINNSDGKQLQIDLLNRELSEKLGSRPKHLWGELYSDVKAGLKKYLKYAREIFYNKELSFCLPHFYLITSYIESLKKDLPPPVPPVEGKKTIRLLECIEESLDKHKIVKMT